MAVGHPREVGEDESASGSMAVTGADSASARGPHGADRRNAPESGDAGYGNSSAAANVEYGAVRIDVRPDHREAQVYVDGAHAGVAHDFDGRSPLYLVPGSYEFEIRLDEHATSRRRILVTPGNTYELRHRMEPVPTGGSSSR